MQVKYASRSRLFTSSDNKNCRLACSIKEILNCCVFYYYKNPNILSCVMTTVRLLDSRALSLSPPGYIFLAFVLSILSDVLLPSHVTVVWILKKLTQNFLTICLCNVSLLYVIQWRTENCLWFFSITSRCWPLAMIFCWSLGFDASFCLSWVAYVVQGGLLKDCSEKGTLVGSPPASATLRSDEFCGQVVV